MAHQSYNT